ncbi:A/G-specific adenine glycosylase [Corynebacterium auris]|uniref:A/G-specific adenine glycosylase n=1 Tax=Corynebacterium auris TaxID=44750 RepID=UPI0025B38C2F|nr:A/G-specific adenine glycosylase [Corynebacterium auris]WJY68788.1 A/G-specific adenine glycosylase [Corynebacterium auris]
MGTIVAPIVIEQEQVIRYYRDNARALPWRAPGTTPWGVLLSEVMSHQTPVARVAPVWQEWIARWPTPRDFAAAGTDEVLRAWGTLGYPRRALRLLECARVIVDKHAGAVPDSVEELLALPGVGDYTARAVACFAYGKNVAVVDTNVRRIYARAQEGAFLAAPRKGEIADVAALLPEVDGPVFSAGLMELGALVCTATNPRCGQCPLEAGCAWVAAGRPSPTEEELKKKKVQKFAGTDRQVRGKIMKLLREADSPVAAAAIDVLWPDKVQLSRALYSLLADHLAEQDERGYFHLPR